MVGRLGLLYKEGQAVGLYGNWAYRVVYLGPKATVLTMPLFFVFFFSIGGLCSPSRGKILCFRALSMENCRLLMRICFNASAARDVLMMH